VAECVKHLKGASAYAINHMQDSNGNFKWQEGYGALSIGERSLDTVKAYATHQKDHHKVKTINTYYERVNEVDEQEKLT
jgi:REP element-mobilizing transposase RayT